MTALELSAEPFRQLSIIAEDRTLIHKAVEAIRRLTQQKEAQTEYINEEEVLVGIRQDLINVKESRKNGTYRRALQEVIDELWNCTTKALSERAEAIGREIPFARIRPSSITR